jgi:hypothetical protein
MNVHAYTALSRLLEEPKISELARAYFDPAGPFAGSTFDDVGENPPDRITPSDLLAVSLLDVSIPAPAVRTLLEHADTWSGYLSEDRVPSDQPLWEMTDEQYAAADEMWQALVALPGVGPTKAGKLMARKRPHLIPIYDEVVGDFLRPWTDDFWKDLRAALADEELRSRVDTLAEGMESRPSTLRLIDVAIWMRNGESTNAKAVRERLGVPIEPLAVA